MMGGHRQRRPESGGRGGARIAQRSTLQITESGEPRLRSKYPSEVERLRVGAWAKEAALRSRSHTERAKSMRKRWKCII